MKKFLMLLALLTLFSGCTSVFVEEPVVTVKGLDLVSVDPAGAVMELSLVVQNRNPYHVRLQGYSYDLKVMALPLVKGGAREEIDFPSKADTELKIPLRVGYRELLDLFKQKLDPDKVPYQLKAGLDLDTPIGKMTVPVDEKGTYKIPKEYRPSHYLDKIKGLLGLQN